MHNRERIWIAAAAWSVGLFAVLCDHLQPSTQVSMGVHALFAVVTCGAICLVLIGKARDRAGASRAQLHLFARLVSRWVYILLYTLTLVRVLIYVYEASGNCMLCGTHADVGPARSLEDFQFYIVCCVASLWLFRPLVLALSFKGRHLQDLAAGQRGDMANPSALP